MNILYIALIVAAVLVGSFGFYFIAKKFGLSLINIPLAIVTAIKSALEGTSVATSKFSTIFNLIIEALSYGNIIVSEDVDPEEKVNIALEYIRNIASELDIVIDDSEVSIIRYVLSIGFTLMRSLYVESRIKYNKLYSKMAKYAKLTDYEKNSGSSRVEFAVSLRKAHY